MIYRHILGPYFDALPRSVQAFHSASAPSRWEGEAVVRCGKGFPAVALRRLLWFPAASGKVPVRVDVTPQGATEVWSRSFGGKIVTSVQSVVRESGGALLVERFGPFRFTLDSRPDGDRLWFAPRRWTCFGVPKPRLLMPSGKSFETERDSMFHFDIEIVAPPVGLIVAYRGLLTRVAGISNQGVTSHV